ncbi:MAG: amidohydrolase [Chloroflexota bacterium]
MRFGSGVLAIVNANVHTMNPARPKAEAVLIKGDRIALVGDNHQILAACPSGANKLDLGGRTLLPGLIDTHVHLMETGLGQLTPSLEGCRCIGDVLRAISSNGPLPGVIPAFGLDPTRLREQRYPTRRELDSVAPDSVVYIARRDLHSASLNSKALSCLSLPRGVVGLELDEDGQPTGVLRAEAWELAADTLTSLIDRPTWTRALDKAVSSALKAGLTTVHALVDEDAGNGCHIEIVLAFQRAAEAEPTRPSLRIVPYLQTVEVDKAVNLGLRHVGGCLLVDGSLGSQTAALSQPYFDRPNWQGVLYFDDAELFDFIRRAHRAGLQVAMHAIGDRAIEQLLDAYERVLSRYPRCDHRHRIEHFLLPTAEQVERAAKLGLCVAVQPAFQYLWGGRGGLYWQRLGAERYERFAAHRTIMQAGICIAGGSDSPVTPMDPLLGIHAAVNSPNERERLGPLDAARLYTANAAWLGFEESFKGTIEAGKLADLVVLDDDPLGADVGSLRDIAVDMTVVGGQVLYSRWSERPASN